MIRRMAAAAFLSLMASVAHAEFSNNVVKIVVLTDMSSHYADAAGKGSVAAAELAIEDFGPSIDGVPIKLLSADHQNKADLGALKARELIDTEGADAFVDFSNSAVSLAVQELGRTNDKAVLHVGSATASLYGENCSPTGALWLYDTYSLAQGLGKAEMAEGAKSWFFISADYAFGKAMEESLAAFVKDAGGTVMGAVRHPLNNPDFSSFLLQAQRSKAQVIAFANGPGDTITALKQAKEFGIADMGQKLTTTIFDTPSAKSVGPEIGQGLRFMMGYYWDRDDASRAFAKRFAAKMNGAMPSQTQAGVYSATLHYLRAAAAAKSDSGKVVLAKMKEMPVNDFFAEGAMVRADGRLMKDMFLFEMKKPSEVTQPWDLMKVLRRMPAAEIIRPLDKGNCPFVKS